MEITKSGANISFAHKLTQLTHSQSHTLTHTRARAHTHIHLHTLIYTQSYTHTHTHTHTHTGTVQQITKLYKLLKTFKNRSCKLQSFAF